MPPRLPHLRCFLSCALLWSLCTAVAEPRQSAPAASLGHQEWSTENGLPQNSVHQIFQTSDGYLWIATEGGIARFNGVTFQPFTQQTSKAFSSDDTCCFAQDGAGRLWIGTADGLLAYTPQSLHRYATADGLPSAVILSLAADDTGALVALTTSGLARFDGNKFAPVSSSSTPTAIAQAPDNSLDIASTAGIARFSRNQLTSPIPNPTGEPIEGLVVLPNDTLWLRSRTAITLIKDSSHQTFTAGHDLPGTRISALLADSRGALWIGTNKGLVVIQPGQPPTPEPLLGSNSILSLFEDHEGNLWVGTEATGLHVLRQQNFHSPPEFSDRVITTIVQTTTHAMAIGTNGDGLDIQQPDKTQHYSTQSGLLSDVILALAPASDGSLWVGTPDGLNHIVAGKIETYTSADGLPDDFIRSLLVDNDNTLWVGTRRGLAHFQNGRFATLTHANGLPSDLIGAILRSSSNDLWIATLNGLARLRDGRIATFTTKDGLAGNTITSLLEDAQHNLWIGTSGNGLSYVAPGGFVSLHATNIPATIQSILEDDHGRLWLTSSHGVTRLPSADLMACGANAACAINATTFGQSDGMPTTETTAIGHPSSWKTADGSLWFATRKGVAIADPNHFNEDRIPPPVVVERFTIDDAEAPSPSAAPEQDVTPGHTRFAFEYAGLSYTAPSKVRYRYQLEGFDKQWTEAGNRRIAYYTNLPSGSYRFRVQAANPDGIWNETGASFTFHVHPPFYRRAWFLALIAAIVIALGVFLYRLRMRRVEARLEAQYDAILAERNRIAREIHDTLAQGFAGVSVQLELASQLLSRSDITSAHQQIDRTRTFVRQGLEDARRSIWELRAATAQDTLPTRLTRVVEQVIQPPLTANVNIGGTYRPLPSDFEGEIIRIAQEALTNVVRHAAATHVDLQLRYDPSRIMLIITDDGLGIPHSSTTDDTLVRQGHFGLQGMRERAAQIKAQLKIDSSPGEGTIITLEAPIAPATPEQKGTTA